jgi:hypothetical protein
MINVANFPLSVHQKLLYCSFAVAQMVEALRYKPEGCGFDSHDVTGIFH